MGTVNPAQSNSGDTIEASDINTPVNQLAAVLNGAIDSTNLADGSVTTAKIADDAVTAVKQSNPYKFSVYRGTSDQTVISNVYTKIQFNTENFDTNNNFDSVTNYRYTAPVTRSYWFSGGVKNNGNGAFAVALYKNGSFLREFYNSTIASGLSHGGGGDLIQMSATDYVELWVYSTNVTIVAGVENTYFSGFLVP